MTSPSTPTLFDNQCCVCHSNFHARHLSHRESIDLLRCSRCKLVFLKSIQSLSQEFLSSTAEFWSSPLYFSKHEEVFHHFFSERLDRIRKYSSNIEKILDVGCGYGFWVKHLADQGINATGIDESEKAVDFCINTHGLASHLSNYESFETTEKYSVITLCDVLEHFSRPDLMLQKCRSQLNRNGIVYIQVPDVLGFKVPLGHGLGLPYHIWQFNLTSLTSLLKNAGFEPLEHWTGVQGVIGVMERGGPDWITRMKWKVANSLKIGNRLQMVAIASD